MIFKYLTQACTHDDKVIVALQVMLPTMATCCCNPCLVIIFKAGNGRMCLLSCERKLKGLLKHNKFSENIFGHVDHITKQKPNITIITSEAYLMCSHNETSAWLAAKSPSCREGNNISPGKGISEAFCDCQEEIQAAQCASMLHKLALLNN